MGARSVFVYGTLMRGGDNHHVLRSLGATLVGPATTTRPRTLIDLGAWPAMTSADGGPCPVTGEVWTIDAAGIAALDRFEGCPDLYRRNPIRVRVDAGEIEAETYVYAGDPDDGEVIASGAWLR